MKKLSGLKPKLIAVSVDSSQGSLVHAEIIADLLRGKAKELKCPLYTFAESAALGSGYLILSCGDKVFADPHSLIGGISASYHSVSLVNAAKMLKVKQTTISTSEVRVNPFEVLKEADEEWVKKILSFQDSALKEAILNYRSQVSVSHK